MKESRAVGFSQRVRLEWLEQAAELALSGQSRPEMQQNLRRLLEDRLSVGSSAAWGSRDKTVSLLLNIWGPEKDRAAGRLDGVRQDGLALFRQLPPAEHLALHWGMTMAVYPFFGKVAGTAGRLARLQETVSAAQVQRRVLEELGERETVARATRRVLRCLVDWGALQDAAETGVYRPAPARPLANSALCGWLVETVLQASGSQSARLEALAGSPALFPFTLSGLNPAQLDRQARLEIFQQGLDQQVIILR